MPLSSSSALSSSASSSLAMVAADGTLAMAGRGAAAGVCCGEWLMANKVKMMRFRRRKRFVGVAKG